MSDAIEGVKPIRRKLASGAERVYYYHRATGHRLPDDPASPAFKAMLDRANREAASLLRPPRPSTRTIATLIRTYQSAPDWTKLAASTRETEQFNINAIEREFGDMPLAAVEQKGARAIFLEWRDELAEEHPRAADGKLVRLARILKFAFDREMIDKHPLATFRRVYGVDRSATLWLPEHFAALNAEARPEIRLAAFVALHTGQRRGDLIALRWGQYDGSAIRLTQSKTGAQVFIPCTKALRTALDELRALASAARLDVEMCPILLSPSGRPWTIEAFKTAWRRAFQRSGITADLHFHDIRGTAVTMLAEAGCTVPEIASITGHALESAQRIIDRYLARTNALAVSAIAKLEARLS
ncbi:Tyrosine recombinase XerC [Methylobacterium tardum]|uniref:Integrase n=1 Tax=Methylobacterium tardum TaxID=374432 RepID=A0AA37TE76_9HYPH|nr:tyrosine-type recombinase/integrase [Methylobacterium tardum]URD35804.1 tyrosine-type recombinase/integrase [Methylobacterium tardum]GJE51806.1 Tyrosine recombinase XerC [Methylobacterium tardum]GLS72336.1 integrase [Methylobacterium tardum]